ncbi:hypothetical protein C922_00567 [Plasmodium inui San Antonio 1]|uniref:Uncharacterized protein n=1 Tax=Plasmodium inui San Antonio 1 TaxID=1237626 RepID=W7AIM7_9APIC|nr:hypothetical protein C922_00567 [Plasmodium inui San Antonio 1]EUD68879.1 hypothetical protein C922_00567 [Plasmodium inui San Antonio 1]
MRGNSESRMSKEMTSGINPYGERKKESRSFGDLSDNYNFLQSNDSIGDSFEEREKRKKMREDEYNKIMESSEEKSDFFNDDKNCYSYSDRSENSQSQVRKAKPVGSAYPLHGVTHSPNTYKSGRSNHVLTLTSRNLEENILRNLEDDSSYDGKFGSDMDRGKSVRYSRRKSVTSEKSCEEGHFRHQKSSLKSGGSSRRFEKCPSGGKVKFDKSDSADWLHRTEYKMAQMGNTRKTGLWFIDTMNEMLDRLCDGNEKEGHTNDAAVVNSSSNAIHLNYPPLGINTILRWPEYLKLHSIISGIHIFPIYEGIRSVFIKYHRKKMERKNKKAGKSATVLSLPTFPHKNGRDRCIPKAYSNLPNLNVPTDSEVTAHAQYAGNRFHAKNGDSIHDDDYDDFLFSNLPYLIQKMRNKYNQFCEHVGETIENMDRENYTFKQYCFALSKMFTQNLINMIPFSKFPGLLSHMTNSVQKCIRHNQNEESMTETDFINTYNLQYSNSKMGTAYSLPMELGTSMSNLGSTIPMNCMGQTKNPFSNSNAPFACKGGGSHIFTRGRSINVNEQQKRHSLSQNFHGTQRESTIFPAGTLEERRNYLTGNFNTLPKYIKTCANNRKKLSNSLRPADLIKMASVKNNALINLATLRKCKSSSATSTRQEVVPTREELVPTSQEIVPTREEVVPTSEVVPTTEVVPKVNTEAGVEEEADAADKHLDNSQKNSSDELGESFNATASENYCTAKSMPLN